MGIFQLPLTPRTGTTFLQKEIFPKHPKINFIPKMKLRRRGKYNWNWEKVKKMSKQKKNNVVSDEMLCYADNRKAVLKQIKKHFPDAKIVFCLRNKESWKKSWYNNYIKSGGVHTFNFWEKNILKDFDFKNYMSIIEKLFDSFFIYHFEDFKKDADNVIYELCNFIGIETLSYKNQKHNESLSKDYLEAVRLLNHFWNTRYNDKLFGILPPKFFPKPLYILKKIAKLLP
jgi:hypothetical protein